MYKRVNPLILAALLAGCSTVATYKPYVGDVVDQAALTADTEACMGYALGYSTPFDFNSIGTSAAQGVANNAAGAALNPLVPVLGGAGGGTSALLSQLGVLNNDQRRVLLLCLAHRGLRSGAYNVMDPNS